MAKRVGKLEQPPNKPAIRRLKEHLTSLKDPKNLLAAATETQPLESALMGGALYSLARKGDPEDTGEYVGGVLGGNLLQAAGIRAGMGGLLGGAALGRLAGKIIPGKKEKTAQRATIHHSGSASYGEGDAAIAPGMDNSDKIPHSQSHVDDSRGTDDIKGREARARGLRTIFTFFSGDDGADDKIEPGLGHSGKPTKSFDSRGSEIFPHINESFATKAPLSNREPGLKF